MNVHDTLSDGLRKAALPDTSRAPLLDRKQVGSLRHIGNLARQLRNDWSNMEGQTDLREDFGALRFQLAYASYALALAHVHRLPAAPGVFRSTFERLIEKMLLPDVWFEWRDTSKGGGLVNFDAPTSDGWVDPVVKDNIMYSAYLQSMSLLYNVLFDDDQYAQPGALTLSCKPKFWGDRQGFTFAYDQNSLNEQVYWNMVEAGYLGVACEPYCVFQVCNQPAILGFRLHDLLTGGSTAEEVTAGYLAAWKEFGGLLDERGHYNTLIRTHVQQRIPGIDAWSDAWCGALMHAWNAEFVRKNYAQQRDRWIMPGSDGALSIKPTPASSPSEASASDMCNFPWMAVWASEVGDTETLNGLLTHADRYMNPRVSDLGGYYYPRNDTEYDADGNLTTVHPILSNALIPYARLNVPNGLHLLYNRPWDSRHFEEPALTDVSFSVDVWRAVFDADIQALHFDVSVSDGYEEGDIALSRVFGRGHWALALSRDGRVIASGDGTDQVRVASDTIRVRRDGEELRLTIGGGPVTGYTMVWGDA
ncbi:hypothetical protein GTY44_20705 [Streptomyces sp. SID5914]|nr:hypothetical protein [Streptomyces sp. SID5914]MZG15877.1 hypothetical protein [Streptomyces sp. SID5914]